MESNQHVCDFKPTDYAKLFELFGFGKGFVQLLKCKCGNEVYDEPFFYSCNGLVKEQHRLAVKQQLKERDL